MDMNIVTLPKRGLKKYDYNIDMEKEDLKKLSKGQLIKLLLKQKESKKVSNHEDLLNKNPFKDEVAQEPAKPRTDRPLQMQNAPRPLKLTRKHLNLQNQRTISISMMTYSKLKTQVSEISK